MSPEKKHGRMVKTITLRATPDEAWKALAEAEGITRWFAPEAKVKPGPGGEIYLAWGGQGGAAPITIWEPGRRLEVTESAAAGVKVATEYELEAKGGTTVLRLVQSGFEEASDGEASLDRGWDLFLSNLRFALERARGLPCAYGFAQVKLEKPDAAAFSRLLGPALLGLQGDPGALAPGARVVLAPAGERLEAEVDLLRPGIAFAAARLDRPERLGFTIEPWGAAFAYRLAYGLAPAEAAAHLERWTTHARGAEGAPAASGG